MAIDDCMYDYLRPSDCWTDNPWAYHLRSTSDIATVCDENTEGAKPLYDAIDGDICLYTVGKRYTDEECERWEKELKSLVIKKTVAFEESDPNVADKTTTKRLTAGCVVVKDGEIISGCRTTVSLRKQTISGLAQPRRMVQNPPSPTKKTDTAFAVSVFFLRKGSKQKHGVLRQQDSVVAMLLVFAVRRNGGCLDRREQLADFAALRQMSTNHTLSHQVKDLALLRGVFCFMREGSKQNHR